MLLEKENLVNYIISQHYQKTGKPICSLKLHCSLYYLYAMWGGKTYPSKDLEYMDYFSHYDDDLFDGSFYAWRYGPRDPIVYLEYKDYDLKQENVKLKFLIFDTKQTEMAQGYIDSLLSQIFRTHEFALVDLLCEDRCYINAKGDRINNDEIKREYAER